MNKATTTLTRGGPKAALQGGAASRLHRLGLQCLTNLDQLPPKGALILSAPLKIRNRSGSPSRALALVLG